MTARRWIALALVVAALVAIAPPASHAQIPMIANGIIHATSASVNAANSTAEILLYQYPIPAALWASWTTNNQAFASVPIHLRLNGGIKTVGTVGGITGNSLAVNLTSQTGVQIATMVIMNGATIPADLGGGACGGATQAPNACQAPITVDVVVNPIATLTTQNATDLRPQVFQAFLTGRVAVASTTQGVVSNTLATENAYNATTFSQANNNQTAVLNVVWRWGSAASGNSLNIYNGVLKLGF
jgi:hypothetical protein